MNDLKVSKSGYVGKDSMRAQAMKNFGGSLKGSTQKDPKSYSSPEHEQKPFYKKGGEAKMMKGGMAMSSENMASGRVPTDSGSMAMKRGGHAKTKRYAEGGMADDGGLMNQMKGATQNPMPPAPVSNFSTMPVKIPLATYKKGGMVNDKKGCMSKGTMTKGKMSIVNKENMNKRMTKVNGKPIKMAIGGAAKVRHGVANQAGKPILRKVNKEMK